MSLVAMRRSYTSNVSEWGDEGRSTSQGNYKIYAEEKKYDVGGGGGQAAGGILIIG